jgi:hypothetical protein
VCRLMLLCSTGFQQNATYICHALQAWQQTVAKAVARTVAATGCDGVRLDGIGNFHHADCMNPAHHHAHAFTNHGHEADVGILRASRAALDALPGGRDVLLSTEGFADLYNMCLLCQRFCCFASKLKEQILLYLV